MLFDERPSDHPTRQNRMRSTNCRRRRPLLHENPLQKLYHPSPSAEPQSTNASSSFLCDFERIIAYQFTARLHTTHTRARRQPHASRRVRTDVLRANAPHRRHAHEPENLLARKRGGKLLIVCALINDGCWHFY